MNIDGAPALTHLETLNCLACHDRDGQGGPDPSRRIYFDGDHNLGDSGLFPPPLSEVGRKLKPDWLVDAISGEKVVRPYMHTQMPVFGESVRGLANVLFEADANGVEEGLPRGDVEIGRKLLGTLGGLNCITCHNWGNRTSLGIQALDLKNLAERLQPEWFRDYLIDPAHYRTNTLMPSFWPNGVASNQEILEGDTNAQIASIYSFSKSGRGLPEGFPDENTADYEIVPFDRPVVQRTFFEGVGTHALLVGFPEGVHFAFDGESGRPAMLWKGRFFDAYRTWFSRFPEFEKPLGEKVVRWSTLEQAQDSRYQGYRLDEAGVPEFEIRLDGAVFYEKLQPVNDDTGTWALQRTIRYTNELQMDNHPLEHPEGVQVSKIETSVPLTRSFVYRW